MQKSAPASNPDAYIDSLNGWQRRYAEALRSAVSSAASLQETVKWGHLVYFSNGPVLLIRRRRSVSSLAFGEASACGKSSLVSSLVASSNWQHLNWSREPLWIDQQWSTW